MIGEQGVEWFNNIKRNQKVLGDDQEYILWVNDKKLVPNTVKIAEELGLTVRELSEIREQHPIVADKSINFSPEGSAWPMGTYVDYAKYVVAGHEGGICLDLNYKFKRNLTPEERQNSYFKHYENYLLITEPNSPHMEMILKKCEEKESGALQIGLKKYHGKDLTAFDIYKIVHGFYEVDIFAKTEDWRPPENTPGVVEMEGDSIDGKLLGRDKQERSWISAQDKKKQFHIMSLSEAKGLSTLRKFFIKLQPDKMVKLLGTAYSPKVVTTLINAGLDPKQTDSDGRTALFYAVSVEVAAELIDAGADICLRNKKGKTAPILDDPEMQKFIEEREQRLAAAKTAIERADAERRAKSAEDKAGMAPAESESSKDFGNRVAAARTISKISPQLADKSEALPAAPSPSSWWGAAKRAGSAIGSGVGSLLGYDSSRPPSKSGAMAAETPPPTSEQLRQMGVTTEAELAARQQRIDPDPQHSSSSHAPKVEPTLSDPGPRRWWHPNPKAEYDEEMGESAIAVSNAVNTAIPLVGAGLRYFGAGLTHTQKVVKDVSGALSTSKAGTYRLDAGYERATPQKKAEADAYKTLMLEKVDAVKESINETCFLFHDRYDGSIDELNVLPEPHNDAEREAKEALRAECDAAKQMRDDAADLTITLGELHSAVEKRKMLSPENREFLEQQLKILEEATMPIEEVARPLKQEGQSPRQRPHAKQQRKPRRRQQPRQR